VRVFARWACEFRGNALPRSLHNNGDPKTTGSELPAKADARAGVSLGVLHLD